MPMPMPMKSEDHDEFMDRCMGSGMMQDEYPDEKDREAACEMQWGKKAAPPTRERRSFTFVRAAAKDGEPRRMVGHAAVFGEVADIGGWFREQIAPGAFTASIQADDIRALFNHDPNYVLGRNTAKTLTLSEDETGLRVEIDPPDTQFARDLAVSMARGDITQMSFAFEVLDEEWQRGEDTELDLRTLKKVRLYDVSPVTFPAYEGTDIALRSHDAWRQSSETPPPAPPAAAPAPATLGLRRALLDKEL